MDRLAEALRKIARLAFEFFLFAADVIAYTVEIAQRDTKRVGRAYSKVHQKS